MPITGVFRQAFAPMNVVFEVLRFGKVRRLCRAIPSPFVIFRLFLALTAAVVRFRLYTPYEGAEMRLLFREVKAARTRLGINVPPTGFGLLVESVCQGLRHPSSPTASPSSLARTSYAGRLRTRSSAQRALCRRDRRRWPRSSADRPTEPRRDGVWRLLVKIAVARMPSASLAAAATGSELQELGGAPEDGPPLVTGLVSAGSTFTALALSADVGPAGTADTAYLRTAKATGGKTDSAGTRPPARSI